MGKPTGFIEIARSKPPARPVPERIRDWNEIYLPHSTEDLREQGARCMDCSIPFCHHACPLGNVIPDWNDFVYRDRWKRAIERLLATNNFPEFTGRLCPAPCEGACVLGINDDPVAIKSIELAIVERAFDDGWIRATPPLQRTGKRVAIVGSGPAGLAAADQLNRAGHVVTVFERADRIGGLLRYGIPAFKLEKRFLDRRLALLEAEGIVFRSGIDVGVDVEPRALLRDFDATLLAGGATIPRDLHVPGRELAGIHFAMEYLGDPASRVSAAGKRVVIIGGGDTGADCLGTAHRQGALSVYQLELLSRPPDDRAADNPWPEWPRVFRVSSAHEEGGERLYCVSTERFTGDEDGHVRRLHLRQVDNGIESQLDADLVLLAMGFTGPQRSGLLDALGVRLTDRGTVWRDGSWMTSVPGIFTAGDMQRGQSLIVWAIADGREAARHVNAYLRGATGAPSQRLQT